MSEHRPHVIKDNGEQLVPPPQPPHDMVPKPRQRWPEEETTATEYTSDKTDEDPTASVATRRKFGKLLALGLSGVIVLGTGGVIGHLLTREKKDTAPPEGPDQVTSAPQIPGPASTSPSMEITKTPETKTSTTERFEDATIYIGKERMSLIELQQEIAITMAEAPSPTEALNQFGVSLSRIANLNNTEEARSAFSKYVSPSGKTGVKGFNEDALGFLYSPMGMKRSVISNGANLDAILLKQMEDNLENNTFSKFYVTEPKTVGAPTSANGRETHTGMAGLTLTNFDRATEKPVKSQNWHLTTYETTDYNTQTWLMESPVLEAPK